MEEKVTNEDRKVILSFFAIIILSMIKLVTNLLSPTTASTII